MKIGILGCGYVGKAAAVYFKQRRYQIAVTTRKPERLNELQDFADTICLITSQNDYRSFIEDLDILIIAVAPGSSATYESTYLKTAKQVTSQLQFAKHLRQIIYLSSTSVYGDHQGAWIDEETVCQPLNPNQEILLATEHELLKTMSSKISVCIYRLGEIFGPGRLIEDRLRNSINKSYPGNGSSYTNLIHLDDIVTAIDLATTTPMQGIFNLCNDFHISRKEFYSLLCDRFHLPQMKWDEKLTSHHSGNKRVSNKKVKDAGMRFLPLS